MAVAVVPRRFIICRNRRLPLMVGGYFLRLLIVKTSVASAISTRVYVNISLYDTIAAPPLQEVNNLAVSLDYIFSMTSVLNAVNYFLRRSVFCALLYLPPHDAPRFLFR